MRNVAIIAHVDHGKTTLVDRILKQCEVKLLNERMMDSNQIEKERGITILAKVTAVTHCPPGEKEPILINVVDTPGHADFGGEVERVLSMVDGAILVVDVIEGPMTQTKFVVSKALQYNLKPILVINKVDREGAIEGDAESAVFDLLASLNATDEQLDFPVLYGSARDGWVSTSFADRTSWKEKRLDITPLLNTICSHVPPPKVDTKSLFSFLVTMVSRDPYLGKIVTGKVYSGIATPNDLVSVMNREGTPVGQGRVTKIRASRGLRNEELPYAIAGDILSLTGIESASIGDTLANVAIKSPLFTPKIDPPTVSVTFLVNDSPIKGKEGSVFTSQKLADRLFREAETNPAMKVGYAKDDREKLEVQGRGELQLGILMENIRREGVEFAVSPPRVLFQRPEGEPDSKEVLEPIEDLIVEVDEEHSGTVIDKLSRRHGHVSDINNTAGGRTRIKMTIPARCLIGFRPIFTSDTRGSGILYSTFREYAPFRGETGDKRKGVIISMADGEATAHALESIQDRGILFITPGTACYNGMIVGESAKDSDVVVNPVRRKETSNVRSVLKEEKLVLVPPRIVNLESAIGYVQAGELIEVTPQSIRLRKVILDEAKRRAAEKHGNPYN